MKTSIPFIGQPMVLLLTRLKGSHRRLVFGILFLSQFVVACGKSSDVIDPATQSPPPADVSGKWTYGTFSPSSFWGTNGSYNGAASEQAMAFNFGPNGTYELYVMNITTYYSCRTGAYTYYKGKAKFNEADGSITLTPTQGTQRGEYSCASGKDFKRDASANEMAKAHQTIYYTTETDAKGKPALRLYFGPTDKQGIQFKTGNW